MSLEVGGWRGDQFRAERAVTGPSPPCLLQMGRLRPTLPTLSLVCFLFLCNVCLGTTGPLCRSKDFPEAMAAAMGHPTQLVRAEPCNHPQATSLSGLSQSPRASLPASLDGGRWRVPLAVRMPVLVPGVLDSCS